MYYPLSSATLDSIVAGFQRDGVVVLTDVDSGPLDILTRMLAEQSGLSTSEIRAAGRDGGVDISSDVRAKLARGYMTPELRESLAQDLCDNKDRKILLFGQERQLRPRHDGVKHDGVEREPMVADQQEAAFPRNLFQS